MALAVTLAKVSLIPTDHVRYLPEYADPYREELAEVIEILDESKDPLRPGSNGMPYWLKVRFEKDKKVCTLPARRFLLEERRMTVA